MTTKLKQKIMMYYFSIGVTICTFIVAPAEGNTMAIPAADKAIERAGFVATGKIAKHDGKVFFMPSEVLKGKHGMKDIEISEIVIGELISPDVLMKISKESQIVFVGNIDETTGKLVPTYGLSSIWPQGVPKNYLKGNDVTIAIESARKIVKIQQDNAQQENK